MTRKDDVRNYFGLPQEKPSCDIFKAVYLSNITLDVMPFYWISSLVRCHHRHSVSHFYLDLFDRSKNKRSLCICLIMYLPVLTHSSATELDYWWLGNWWLHTKSGTAVTAFSFCFQWCTTEFETGSAFWCTSRRQSIISPGDRTDSKLHNSTSHGRFSRYFKQEGRKAMTSFDAAFVVNN